MTLATTLKRKLEHDGKSIKAYCAAHPDVKAAVYHADIHFDVCTDCHAEICNLSADEKIAKLEEIKAARQQEDTVRDYLEPL